jgi:predicted TPR repeat methyltransferase
MEPTHAEVLRAALAAHKEGRYADAEHGYRRVLCENPSNPKALYFLGLLHFHRGRTEPAIESVAQALKSAPNHAQVWNTFGGMLIAAGREAEALQAYRRAVDVAPEAGEGWYNLGICLRNAGNVGQAVATLREAIKRDAEFYRAYGALAALLYQTGELEEASKLYIEWAARDPSNAYATHMAAASTGENVPPRASDDYVKTHFNDFAARFDATLAQLGYNAPLLVADTLARVLPASEQTDRGRLVEAIILDAGCGTGLCAPLIRELCRTLVGVDLSEQMLARAQERGLYDELVASELCEFMRSRPGSFDAVVSADTLCYFGLLAEPLKAARETLRDYGVLIFTLEALANTEAPSASNATDFTLEPHGRYTHSESYVRRELAATGFEATLFRGESVRREGERDVPGWLVVATRL